MNIRSLAIAASAFLGLMVEPSFAQNTAIAPQLDTIRERGSFRCGVYENVPGLSALDAQGRRVGLDVDYCHAMAAAILGDPTRVEFRTIDLGSGHPCAALR